MHGGMIIKFLLLAALLLGLPLFGIWIKGEPLKRYLEFPPQKHYIVHEEFSWMVFWSLAVLIAISTLPLILKAFKKSSPELTAESKHPFPWWGWLGVVITGTSWIFAWTRFPWFQTFQPHTFTPLWIGYILIINALCFRRSSHCMLLDRPKFFFLMFPLSAGFWWFFEYLNRFVQNWYYTEQHQFGPTEYFWYATLPFSTVLPAVLGTQEWLSSFSFLEKFRSLHQTRILSSRWIAWSLLLISSIGLFGIGIWPNLLFPLLWVSPLLILASLQILGGGNQLVTELSKGDWRSFVSFALAGLVCGFFWEMWNYYSYAKWIYTVPYVDRFHIFEMPLIGYAGYLPFGLECAVIMNPFFLKRLI
jgi:hypothetical protein